MTFQGYVNCNQRAIFQEIVLRITDAPKWSPTVLDCQVGIRTFVRNTMSQKNLFFITIVKYCVL